MFKKIHFVIVNIVTFILLVLMIALPIFSFVNPDTVFEDGGNSKIIFGFHFLTGFTMQDISNPDIGEGIQKVMYSKLLGFIPVMMIFSIFVIDKFSKNSLGKDAINFLASALVFVYFLLLPGIFSVFLVDKFVDASVHTSMWGYWIILITTLLLFLYYTFVFVKNILKFYKENDKKEINS